MGMEAKKYNVTEMTEKFYDVKECKPTERTVKHIKKKPVCKPVTKHDCVTKWEVLDNGDKVCNSDILFNQCLELRWRQSSQFSYIEQL